MANNGFAATDSRFARTGKDGAFYDEDGKLLASVESFSSNVSFTNAKYSVLGDAQEHETPASYSVSLTMSQIVVEDDQFICELMQSLQTQIMPVWKFSGMIKGVNGGDQRIVYYDCIPSGQVDLQNITVGDVVKRSWNFFVNRPPELQDLLTK